MIIPIDAKAGMRKCWTLSGKTTHLRRPDPLPANMTYGIPRYLTLCGQLAANYNRGLIGPTCKTCQRIAGAEAP